MTELVCTCARIDGYRITRADCPIHPMQPRRPAHENPLWLTFTREELDEAMAAARAEGARDMRTKIEALADDFHDRSQSHAWPTPSSMAYRDAWRTASTVLRALLADGGEPQ